MFFAHSPFAVRCSRLAARYVLLTTACVALTGCPKPDELTPFQGGPRDVVEAPKDYDRPLAPGQMALRKIPLEQYPDFSQAFYDRAALERSIRNSLAYLAKPSSRKYFPYLDVSHARAVASLEAFLQTLSVAQTPQQLNAVIRRDYEVYESVGYDDRGTVFFTGYYTPIFDGRRERDEIFKYPLYRRPPDLVSDAEGNILGRRTPDGQLVPYFSRREIESQGLLDGTELVWLNDPFAAYVVNIQGSGKIRQADGSILDIGYAGTNGLEYRSIARQMISDGVIKKNELSLQAMMRFFQQNPQQVRRYTWLNPRFAFFQESAPGGPFGSLNAPVTPYYSIATDKGVFPRACLAYITAPIPTAQGGQIRTAPYASFTLDQDTGGAIRAAGRCDVFMGVGPQAEAIAGRVGAEGRLYYLFVRNSPQ